MDSEVIIPSIIDGIKVNKIADNCFDMGEMWNACSSIVIEEGVEEIGNYCFASCLELVKIIIPSSINKIGNNLFNDCEA